MGSRRQTADKSRLNDDFCAVQSTPSPSERWLEMDVEINQLALKWATLETQLARDFGWFNLSAIERRALPQAARLFAIEKQLDRLSVEREQQLESLTQLQPTDLKEVAQKLAVVVRILEHEEGPAHKLVADAVDAMATHCCPQCGTSSFAEAKER